MGQKLPFKLRTVAAGIVVIASGLIILTSYQSIINSSDETPQALPIIHADKEPFRVLPEDPGGAEILNKDSTLFDVMDAERDDPLALSGAVLKAEEAEPETLFEAPAEDENAAGFEMPQVPEKRTESLYGMIEDLKDRDDREDTVEEVDDVVQKEVMDEADRVELKEKLEEAIEKIEEEQVEKEAESVVDFNSPLPTVKPAAPKKTVAKIEKSQEKEKFSLDKVLSSSPSKKGYYIQLASLRSEADARAAYSRIRGSFPNLVNGVGVVFPKADLGARGTFTRIQVGPMEQSEAKKRCADYSSSAKGGTCLVLSR